MLNAFYVALGVLALCWVALAFYFIRTARLVRLELEKLINETESLEEQIALKRKITKTLYPPRFNRGE